MKIKKIIATLLALITVVSCSGCSLNFFSVESLLAPPKQAGKNGQVQEAFNKLFKGVIFQLKTPASGDYQTSIILKDVNNDQIEEAFVFYSDTSAVESSVRLAFMEFRGREWVLSADIKGVGTGVYDVAFQDINNDGISEVFINWSLIDAGSSRIVTVYTFEKTSEGAKFATLANEYANAQAFVDFNGDGNRDLVVVYLDDTGLVQKSFLRFFTMNKNADFLKYAEIELDNSIISVEKIFADKLTSTENGEFSRIFIECMKNERMCFTELVYWDNNYQMPVKAFKQPTVSNLRYKGVYSFDIDGDGLFEVPSLITLYGDENALKVSSGDEVFPLSLVKWNNVKSDKKSDETIITLYNPKDDYLFKFPWGKAVTVYYDELRNAFLFCEWNDKQSLRGDELFSVSYREETTENEIIGNLIYKQNKGAYYYKITDKGKAFGISDGFIVSSFIKMN